MTNSTNISTANASNSNHPNSVANLQNAAHDPECSGTEGHDKHSTIQPVRETKAANTKTQRSFNNPSSSLACSSRAAIPRRHASQRLRRR